MVKAFCSVRFTLRRAMHEFYDKLEEAAAICRRLAAEADDAAEAQAMKRVVEMIEQVIEMAKKERLFFQ